jgi:Zn-dependent peptidase ImmA (M78 family)/transcriptional regulator with XRE-family HTH domain
MDLTNKDLDLIFGPDSHGSTCEERALTSSRVFVRSQDHFGESNASATGHILTAWEALHAFGVEKMLEAMDYGSAILPFAPSEPAETLRARRESLGLTIEDLAKFTGLGVSRIEDAENPATRTPIRDLERIAQKLALDEQVISFVPQANGDSGLAFRLKELRSPQFTAHFVVRLCEAAWVIYKQWQLYHWLYPDRSSRIREIEPSPNYGKADYPVWMHGYFLAQDARRRLGIPADQPIEKLHAFIEEDLGIPVVQQGLPSTVAGATVANGVARGITANITGPNENVWVRRVTLAHELGHLLWDPDANLRNLQVDDYRCLDENPRTQKDFVEARANAFAVEFLAPHQAALRVFENSADARTGLRNVMEEFGLSFTSARYHIWNGLERSITLESLNGVDPNPTDEWVARESFGLFYIEPRTIPDSRRGLFASLVVKAVEKRFLSEETGAMYLSCTLDELRMGAPVIRDMFD